MSLRLGQQLAALARGALQSIHVCLGAAASTSTPLVLQGLNKPLPGCVKGPISAIDLWGVLQYQVIIFLFFTRREPSKKHKNNNLVL